MKKEKIILISLALNICTVALLAGMAANIFANKKSVATPNRETVAEPADCSAAGFAAGLNNAQRILETSHALAVGLGTEGGWKVLRDGGLFPPQPVTVKTSSGIIKAIDFNLGQLTVELTSGVLLNPAYLHGPTERTVIFNGNTRIKALSAKTKEEYNLAWKEHDKITTSGGESAIPSYYNEIPKTARDLKVGTEIGMVTAEDMSIAPVFTPTEISFIISQP